jgi:hypothetical protein
MRGAKIQMRGVLTSSCTVLENIQLLQTKMLKSRCTYMTRWNTYVQFSYSCITSSNLPSTVSSFSRKLGTQNKMRDLLTSSWAILYNIQLLQKKCSNLVALICQGETYVKLPGYTCLRVLRAVNMYLLICYIYILGIRSRWNRKKIPIMQVSGS